MPITGRLTTAGRLIMCGNYPQEFHDDLNFEEANGIVLEMDEANTRAACGLFLNRRVAIWSADELAPHTGSHMLVPTHENMQHLAMRLEAAEERLAREVRSNEAATRVRVDLEARLKQALQDLHHAERLNDDNGLPTLARLADLEAQCKNADECLASRLATIGKMCDERDAALAEVDRLTAELAEAKKTNTSLTRMVLARNADVERLNAERDRLAAELAGEISEGNVMRRMLKEMAGDLDEPPTND